MAIEIETRIIQRWTRHGGARPSSGGDSISALLPKYDKPRFEKSRSGLVAWPVEAVFRRVGRQDLLFLRDARNHARRGARSSLMKHLNCVVEMGIKRKALVLG